MMKFFHATTPEAAASILAGGFRDRRGPAGMRAAQEGIYIAQHVFIQGGPKSTVLAIDLDATEEEMAEFAVVESRFGVEDYMEDGLSREAAEAAVAEQQADDLRFGVEGTMPVQEWIVPSVWLNARGRVRLASADEC